MKKVFYLFPFALFAVLTGISCKKEGCTDKTATNFKKDARKDNGSCKYVDGCMDPNAVNFSDSATRDDGTCTYEFVADNSTFAGFSTWVLQAINEGADPANLGEAHGGNDSSTTRTVYFYNGQDPEEGMYPRGTLIVKHTQSDSGNVNVITAMAKRGGGYNQANNGWEWFILNMDGSIATDENGKELRGANLLNGSCGSCHAAAFTDFVHSK